MLRGCVTPEGAASQRDPHRACGCGRALGASRALGAPRRSGASTGTLRLAQAAGAAGRGAAGPPTSRDACSGLGVRAPSASWAGA